MQSLTKRQNEVVAAVQATGDMGLGNFDPATRKHAISPALLSGLVRVGVLDIRQDTRAPGCSTRYFAKAVQR